MKRMFAVVTLTLIAIAGCSNPKEANNDNFTHAINAYLAVKGKACLNTSWQFPVDIQKSQISWNKTRLANMEALESAGLLKATDTSAMVHTMFSAESKSEPVRRYSLTDTGKKYLQPTVGLFASGTSFCYGQESVDSIVKWTVPSTVGGFTVTRVVYTYRLKNMADWAHNPQIIHQFHEVQQEMEGANSEDRTIALELTNKGWDTCELSRGCPFEQSRRSCLWRTSRIFGEIEWTFTRMLV
jgi:hypothetical protein